MECNKVLAELIEVIGGCVAKGGRLYCVVVVVLELLPRDAFGNAASSEVVDTESTNIVAYDNWVTTVVIIICAICAVSVVDATFVLVVGLEELTTSGLVEGGTERLFKIDLLASLSSISVSSIFKILSPEIESSIET